VGSAEREHKGLHARIEKLDLELSIGDGLRLSDHLIQPLFGSWGNPYRPRAVAFELREFRIDLGSLRKNPRRFRADLASLRSGSGSCVSASVCSD